MTSARRTTLLALVAVVACSSLGEPGEPVAIEFLIPAPALVEVNDTIQLRARVLDLNGDSIAAEIRWRTPDSTVGVDSLTDLFWGLLPGSGRVQPTSGSLVGTVATFSVRARADTVIISTAAESLFVATADSVSASFTPKVAQINGTGLADRKMIFTLLEPTDSSVALTGDVFADTVTTKADGTPSVTIRLRKRTPTAPDSALVEVGARRFSGDTVAGSGQRIRIFFE